LLYFDVRQSFSVYIKYIVIFMQSSGSSLRSEIEDLVWKPSPLIPSSVL